MSDEHPQPDPVVVRVDLLVLMEQEYGSTPEVVVESLFTREINQVRVLGRSRVGCFVSSHFLT